MPTTYAHYTFGQEVLKNLSEDTKNIINNNRELFNIGLHGPDILFYYNALKSNKISKLGHRLHKQQGSGIFNNARKIIRESTDSQAASAYVFGFLCHFMLDSSLHPYIRQKEGKRLTHSTIETELDRFFMLKNNLDPISYKPTAHIIPNDKNAGTISCFFEEVTADEVLKALKSMKFYLNFLVSPKRIKRHLISAGLKLSGNYEGMIGLMMSYEPVKECNQINEKLYKLYEEAIIPAAKLIEEYKIAINNNNKLNERFSKTFE